MDWTSHLAPALLAVATTQGGLITAAQARAGGCTPKELQWLRDRKVVVSVRRGVYADRAALAGLGPAERHVLEVRAALLVLQEPTTVSHVSAALLHDLELLEPDLKHVHVTRPELRASRLEAGIHHHAASLAPEDIVAVGGLRATSLARTAVDVARDGILARAVAVVDSALRAGVAPEQLREVMAGCAGWPGARTASRAVAFGDGRAANPGESFSRVVIARLGLPPPDLQAAVYDADGLIGYADFRWRDQCLVGEFDGRLKYAVPPGADLREAGRVVWREKVREDRMRAAGYDVVRWTYADLRDPAALGRRLWARMGFWAAARRPIA